MKDVSEERELSEHEEQFEIELIHFMNRFSNRVDMSALMSLLIDYILFMSITGLGKEKTKKILIKLIDDYEIGL